VQKQRRLKADARWISDMAFYIWGDYQFCETFCQVSWTQHVYKSA
jgi:hypothetical protein